MKNFILLTTQRSGSTWFIDILNKTEGINAYGELFIPLKGGKKQTPVSELTSLESRESEYSFILYQYLKFEWFRQRPFSVFLYLNTFYGHGGHNGFKLMYSQLLFYPEVWLYILLNKISIVHLVRSNFLNIIISTQIRKITGIPHVDSGQAKILNPKIHLDPKKTINKLRWLNRNYWIARILLRMFNVQNIEIKYEDLQVNKILYQDVLQFLSVDDNHHVNESKFQKIVTKEHKDLITNYFELKAHLEQTRFGWMIN